MEPPPRATNLKVLSQVAGTVRYVDNGYLDCVACRDIWCSHIDAVMRAGLDSESIVKWIVPHNFISVPVLPTEGIYARVWLEVVPRERFLAKAYLQSPMNAEADRIERGDDHFLAFLSAGEGRGALRVALWDSLAPEFESTVSCQSHGHTWDVNLKATSLQESGLRGQMMNGWTARWYKKCHHCYNREGAGLKFDDDLIPDVPRTRHPFR